VTAAQLAARLPLIQHGRRAVRAIELETSLTGYLAVPCYGDVLVIACTGERALRPWATLPAPADAAGRILLAHLEAWRQSLAAGQPQAVLDKEQAASIAARGHALIAPGDERTGSLAVPVPATDNPIAALGLRGPSSDLIAEKQLLVELLQQTAAQLARE
jgi:DNA-binding IclR family transcriptional regulator